MAQWKLSISPKDYVIQGHRIRTHTCRHHLISYTNLISKDFTVDTVKYKNAEYFAMIDLNEHTVTILQLKYPLPDDIRLTEVKRRYV